jgi:hypothetical protein
MRFIVETRVMGDKKRTYLIDANSESEVKHKVELRLPPAQREDLIIDSIKIDPKSLSDDDIYGIFSED